MNRDVEKMRVLIADDSASYRFVVETAILELGFEPVSVEDGNQAWEVLSAPNPPSIAIVDWMMPHLTGVELCKKLEINFIILIFTLLS